MRGPPRKEAPSRLGVYADGDYLKPTMGEYFHEAARNCGLGGVESLVWG